MDKQLLGLVRSGFGRQQQQQSGQSSGQTPGQTPGQGGQTALPLHVLGTLRGVASGALASALMGRRSSSSEAAALATAATASASAGGGAAPQQQQAEGRQGEEVFVPGTLKQLMGLPEAPAGPVPRRALPSAPSKMFLGAHKGAVCSVAAMRPGERPFWGILLRGGPNYMLIICFVLHEPFAVRYASLHPQLAMRMHALCAWV